MAKKKVRPEEVVITPPEDVKTVNGCAEGETQPLCGFSHIRYIVIQEAVKKKALKSTAPSEKTKTFTYPIKEAAAPLRHANKYLLGNQWDLTIKVLLCWGGHPNPRILGY